MDIESFLKSKSKDIDKIITKYIPKRISKEWLENFNPNYGPDVKALQLSLANPIWNFLDRGGKRWRPALFLLLLKALGGDVKKFRDWAALIELAHEGSIVIDDIEDNSLLRRGKPCLHRIFGTDIAINAGNFMYFLPLLIFKKQLDKKTKLAAWKIWAEEMSAIHLGQALDIQWHKTATIPNQKQYLQMVAWKTGTLARMAARLAALFAGQPEHIQNKIGRFAEAIGIAFQIQDDILDIVGNRKLFGKAWGNDITEGKKTLIVIYTLKNASQAERAKLLSILNMHTRNKKLIGQAIGIIKKYNGVALANKVAVKLLNKAWAEIEPLLKPSQAKETLRAFTKYLIERKW
jgi:geranylgeranyl pyrophosphate synthase